MAYKMFCSRRGDFNVLLAVIITLVVGVIIIALGYQINQNSKTVNDDEKCRLSIFTNHIMGKVKQESKVVGFPVAFECPRRRLKIELGDVEKYGRIDDDLFKTVLAEEMKACWAKVGAGTLDPFRTTHDTVDDTFCLVCNEIVIGEDLQEQMIAEDYWMRGFQYWIAKNKLPGIKTTLYEFVSGTKPTEDVLRQLKVEENSDKSLFNLIGNRYIIAWRVQKYEPGLFDRIKGVVIGAVVAVGAVVVGAVVGVASFGTGIAATAAIIGAGVGLGIRMATEGDVQISQSVFIAPEDTLSSDCTAMIN